MNRFARRCTTSTLVMVLGAGAGAALADDLDTIELLTPDQFTTLTENLGAATHYKAVAPIEQLGVIGFDLGIEWSSTDIDEAVIDQSSGGNSDMDALVSGRLHAHKGLPFGFDIGASVATLVDTDITVLGAELRYAIVEGGVALPAVGVRASYSVTDGSDDFDVENMGLEIGVSKGFLMFTPYGGAGVVRTTVDPTADAVLLGEESVTQEKLFAGVNVNLGINFSLEADRTGDYTTYSAKAGLRF